MWNEVANRAEPPKAKIAPEVCTGLRRPKLVKEKPRLKAGQQSWSASTTPTSIATAAQNMVAMVNLRTTSSL